MRGKAHLSLSIAGAVRITPAHAGKSQVPAFSFRKAVDHPRTCGEKFPKPVSPSIIRGSPPHMRGKVGTVCDKKLFSRITPAHAGKRKKRNLMYISK